MSVVPPDVSEVVDKQYEISSTELVVIVAPAAGLYPAAGTAFLVTIECNKANATAGVHRQF